jgi:Domain of unknown function (DUF4806)
MSYLVVTFPLDDSVSIVRSTWVKTCTVTGKKMILWPNCEDPIKFINDDPSENWRKIYHFEIEAEEADYGEAVTKLKKVMRFSDVETDLDDRGKPIRGAKRKAATNLFKNTESLEKPDNFLAARNLISHSPPALKVPAFTQRSTSQCDRPLNNRILQFAEMHEPLIDSQASFSTASQHNLQQFSSSSTNRLTNDSSLNLQFQTILSHLATISSQNVEILKNQGLIMTSMQTKSFTDETEVLPDDITLPLTDEKDLMILESWLSSKSHRTTFIDFLATIGGSSGNNACRNMLKKLLANSLATKYNWEGTPPKLSFKTYTNLFKVIYLALKKIPKFELSNNDVEKIIKTWLANAKKREIPKLFRNKKKLNTVSQIVSDSDD